MIFRISLFSILLFFVHQLKAQDILKNIENHAAVSQEERIYIHFDKTSYSPGESIWFKAYIMKTIYPEDDSKTLYVDFSDEKGNLLLHSTSAIIDGTSFSQFDISPKYTGQFISIKAYTKWMLNFDSSFLYHKEIKILHKNGSALTKKSKPDQITFFPEGGNIIGGIVNKIAFKMNDEYGRPVKGTGVIQNKSGKFIDSLRIIHDGMGYFYLNPQPGETFLAKWHSENAKEQSIDLPPVMNNGLGMQVGIFEDKRSLKISSPEMDDSRQLHVIGTMYQQSVFNFSRSLVKGNLEAIIPVLDLPSGILVITVFDEKWNPLAERITYVNNEEYIFHPEITVQHWGLNKRAKNELLITVPDSLVANLSLSVTDGDIALDTSDNIISTLKLTSELKGRVNNPAFYFKDNNESTAKLLDLVMLTNGWRRFNWQNIVGGKMPEMTYPKDTSYLTISGKIYGATPVQLRNAGDIVLLFKQNGQGNNIVNVPISSDGTFSDPNLILFDTANIYYQLPKGKGLEGATVQFMQNRLPPLGNIRKATGDIYNYNTDTTGNSRQFRLADIANQEEEFARAKILETVTIKRKTKTPVEILDEKYASGMFQGGDGYQFDLINDPFAASSINIFSYLQGKVAGLQINTTSNPPSLTWRGGAPGIYLDEMPASADMLSGISVSDVAYIKVIRPPFLGASGGGNGAIAIYTRRGGDVQHTEGKGLSKNVVTGYTAIRQFYSPDYSTYKEDYDKKDIRTTLYWNPEIMTAPGSNKVLLSFYNNDISESFKVVLQGMTKDGRLANVVMEMQ